MTPFTLDDFPHKLQDILSKSWITYKKTFIYFVPFLLLAHVLFALVYFAFIYNSVFTVVYIDITRFLLAKTTDAFACFYLPFFLYKKTISPTQTTKIFFERYLLKILLAAFPLYFLIKYLLSWNLILLVLSLAITMGFLFTFCFLIVENKKVFFSISPFLLSLSLMQVYWKKVALYFLVVLTLTSVFRLLVEIVVLYPDIQKIIGTLGDNQGSLLLKEILQVVSAPKFYLLHSFVQFIYQPFISIFLSILFYSLCTTFSRDLIENFFQPFTTPEIKNGSKTTKTD